MSLKGVILCSNVSVVAASSPIAYDGGRGCLIAEATTYPSTVQLQIQGPSGKYVNIGSATTTDSVQAFDFPKGLYRVNMTGGTASNMYMALVSVPYV